ncbi:UNVERIFIED_CONTAM: hypothetical protein GTU68_011895, partial [Idotea baltica]|nr:hypothetical protein [Idotea baltica]
YVCPNCGKRFGTPNPLKLHLATACDTLSSSYLWSKISTINPIPSTSSGDPCADVETFVSSLGKGKGSHMCIYCGKIYSRKYGLKIHIRTHTGYKPLKCRVCLRPFGDPSNLNKHIRLHAQGDTPYRCELCGKVFDIILLLDDISSEF